MKRRIIGCIVLLALLTAIALPLIQNETTVVRGQLCIESLGTMLEDSENGLTVLAVRKHSPAESMGFMPGDILLSVNSRSITDSAQLDELLLSLSPPIFLECQLLRNDQPLTLSIAMPKYPSKEQTP